MPTHPAASGVSVGAKAATSQTSTPPHAPLAKASIHSRDCVRRASPLRLGIGVRSFPAMQPNNPTIAATRLDRVVEPPDTT